MYFFYNAAMFYSLSYTPPALAIANLYWKVWMMLLIVASYNPLPFGKSLYEI